MVDHLRPGSSCIDTGISQGAPATDLDGHLRPCGKGVDLGAYEFGDCAAAPAFRRGDTNGDGNMDLSDPIAVLGYLFLGNSAPPCLDAADLDDSGILDLTDAVYSLSSQFMGGPPPESPFPGCGVDPTPDDLGCEAFQCR
jgi:hypothetical protein